MDSSPSRRERRSSSILTHDSTPPSASDVSSGHTVQNQGNEEVPEPEDKLRHDFSSGSRNENEDIIITAIRATDVAVGLRRLPAGFYTVVHQSDLEWRTENKRVPVSDDVVEWSGPIPLPSNLAATVCLEVYASFEFEPRLGAGEQLRRLTITVEELLDRSVKRAPFIFFAKDGDVVSPCSSLSVTVQRGKCRDNDSSTSRTLGPYPSMKESHSVLEDATNHGHSALSRYRRHGNKRDLEHSIEKFWQVLNTCPAHHPCRAAAQLNLAMAKFIRCRLDDIGSSMEVPLGLLRDALATRPVGHADRPFTLIYLAVVYLTHFEKSGDRVEEARGEELLREALSLSSENSHEHRAATLMLQAHAGRRAGSAPTDSQSSVEQSSNSCLTDKDLNILSVELLEQFEQFGDVADLEQAIGILKRLVKLIPIWDDRYLVVLGNLGTAFWYRFERFGELGDLEQAISITRNVVDLSPHDDLSKTAALNNLGNSFRTRFDRLGELSDLEQAISAHRHAVDLTPDSDPNKPTVLNNLGISFDTRFERIGELSDLEQAISTYHHAVDLAPNSHPSKSAILNNLGGSFFARFNRLAEMSDLEQAISTHRQAVNLTPHGHPKKPTRLNNLGIFFRTRFDCLGVLSDLEQAILMHRHAVDLIPDDHPDKPAILNDLGISFRTRFDRFGEPSDIEQAISAHYHSVDLTPDGHPEKPGYLTNLGTAFATRFHRLGELSDLEHAISTQKDAVYRVTRDGHPNKPGYLNDLGMSLRTRFNRFGELSDLEQAISTHRQAVDLTPDSHQYKPAVLHNLGMAFITRFDRLGELSDLEHAISTLSDAVDLTSDGHPNKPGYLNGLGISFIARFDRLGELSDLERAISAHRHTVDITPDGHPKKPGYLNDLGIAFRTRFDHFRELSDLEQAISTHRYAVDITPDGHPNKSAILNNLGRSFRTRFELFGDLSDLEQTISMHRDAVDLTPHGHYDRPRHLSTLGTSLRTRFDHFQDLTSLEQAISLYSHVASSPIGPIDDRFRASHNWILCARRIHHHSLLHAYSVALSLLPQLAWIGLSLSHRYSELTRAADVVRDAAAAALDEGFPETAVEWLEQGRSIVWGELLQLRSSYEELEATHPDYAHRLRELSAALDQASATREISLSTPSRGVAHYETESSRHHANNHRMLAIERDKLLQEIRRFPGFEQFLLRKQFSDLRSSAHSGPVVILNATNTRCDALIVLAGVDRVIHVPLPNFTLKRSTDLQNTLKGLVRDAREGKRKTRNGPGWESILPLLWRFVVKPVLDALAFSSEQPPEDLSRIFWCPTGPFAFLPIHAAGLYDDQHARPGHKVLDFVVSSYAPTLAILVPPLNPAAVSSGNLRILAVPQPSSDGQSRLPGVAKELNHIRDIIHSSPSTRTILLESSTGTVEEVLDLLQQSDWVHFACHGVQDELDSGLCLADGRRLSLRDIIAVSRPRGGLAFLSACQTATGERILSDEAIHIAAGMLYAGYGGVIGTMWSISDRLAPVIARHIYARLFENGTRPDYRDAARALHEAIAHVRDNGRVSFLEWIPFIHVGL